MIHALYIAVTDKVISPSLPVTAAPTAAPAAAPAPVS